MLKGLHSTLYVLLEDIIYKNISLFCHASTNAITVDNLSRHLPDIFATCRDVSPLVTTA